LKYSERSEVTTGDQFIIGLEYLFGIEILRRIKCKIEWGTFQDMKDKVLDRGVSDHLRCSQQCQNSIVVCNLQVTNKLETFYVNRGKPGGRFLAKYLLILFLCMGSKHIITQFLQK
jgi:hypothetical protein